MPFLNIDDATHAIYSYNNGLKDVKADPAVLWRRLNAACDRMGETWEGIGEKWKTLTVASDKDTDAEKMASAKGWLDLQAIMASIAYEAFKLQPIDDDGNGVTEAHAMNVLCEFVEDREKKDESTETLPCTSEPTVGDHPISSNESSLAASSVTPITTPSISMSPSPRRPMAPRRAGPSVPPSQRRPTRSSSMPPASSTGST